MIPRKKQVIGSTEMVQIPLLGDCTVRARIDTGAKTSSLSALTKLNDSNKLEVTFLVNDAQIIRIFDEYSTKVVVSSNGISEERFVVKMPVKLAGRLINARFNLTDRRTQTYPVLIGRNVLQSKFIVDVATGEPEDIEIPALAKELRTRSERNIV